MFSLAEMNRHGKMETVVFRDLTPHWRKFCSDRCESGILRRFSSARRGDAQVMPRDGVARAREEGH
jgi:hypothetical protein